MPPEKSTPTYWSIDRTYVYSTDHGPVTLVLSDSIPAPKRLPLSDDIIGLLDDEATYKLRNFLLRQSHRQLT